MCWYWCEAEHASAHSCHTQLVGSWKVKHTDLLTELTWVHRNMSKTFEPVPGPKIGLVASFALFCQVSHWRANILAWSSAHTCPPSWKFWVQYAAKDWNSTWHQHLAIQLVWIVPVSTWTCSLMNDPGFCDSYGASLLFDFFEKTKTHLFSHLRQIGKGGT